jgi:hypothetical protein
MNVSYMYVLNPIYILPQNFLDGAQWRSVATFGIVQPLGPPQIPQSWESCTDSLTEQLQFKLNTESFGGPVFPYYFPTHMESRIGSCVEMGLAALGGLYDEPSVTT